ncbi:peptidase S41, partial [Lutimaribacter sp. EGI FJ00014]|nr:peptidase S41 [Lutimaribacter sp. EGI FJ00014]
MIRKLSLLFAGALIGASAVSLVHGTNGTAANAAGTETYRQLAIFGDIFERVRAQYVTPPDEKELVESAINGMLTSLDPHSSYLNADAAQDMRVQTKG